MPTSTFLAKLIGPLLFFVGLGSIANGQIYNAMASQFLNNLGLIYLSGLVTLTVGIAIVLFHNVWDWKWPVLITIIGWLAVIGGVLRIVVPQKIAAVGLGVVSNPAVLPISGLFTIVIGIILCWHGYNANIRAWQKTSPARAAKRRKRR